VARKAYTFTRTFNNSDLNSNQMCFGKELSTLSMKKLKQTRDVMWCLRSLYFCRLVRL